MNLRYDSDLVADLYRDALPSIDALLKLLARFPETNSNDEGRTKLELLFLKQEIAKGTLPVPQKKTSGMATLRRIVMLDASLDYLDPSVPYHVNILYRTLYEGRPIVRPKYLWLVEGCLEHTIRLFEKQPILPGSEEEAYVRELARVREEIRGARLVLPVPEESLPVIAQAIAVRVGPNGKACRLGQERDPGIDAADLEVRIALFDGFCPKDFSPTQ